MAKKKPTPQNVRQGQTIYSLTLWLDTARGQEYIRIHRHFIVGKKQALISDTDLTIRIAKEQLIYVTMQFYATRKRAERAAKTIINQLESDPVGMVHQEPTICTECDEPITNIIVLCRECSDPMHMECMDMDMVNNQLCSTCF